MGMYIGECIVYHSIHIHSGNKYFIFHSYIDP